MALIRISRGIPKYNIQIGPLREALTHNASSIVSVTDAFDPAHFLIPHFHWIPINEIGRSWGYKPFFASKRLLDVLAIEQAQPLIYLCCSGGIHRSPMTAFCWLLSLPGATPESVQKEFFGAYSDMPLDKYKRDIDKGLIPNDLPEFYTTMRDHPTYSYQGILQMMHKYERITYTKTLLEIK